jgi:hypothetical protein
MSKKLAQLLVPAEADYVEVFQNLARLHVEMQRQGATAARLAHVAVLELQMGHLAEAQAAAQLAVRRDRKDAEAHFALARTQVAEAIQLAAKTRPVGVREALEGATDQLREVLKLNPADEEAGQQLAMLDTLLKTHPDAATLASSLN